VRGGREDRVNGSNGIIVAVQFRRLAGASQSRITTAETFIAIAPGVWNTGHEFPIPTSRDEETPPNPAPMPRTAWKPPAHYGIEKRNIQNCDLRRPYGAPPGRIVDRLLSLSSAGAARRRRLISPLGARRRTPLDALGSQAPCIAIAISPSA